jgi:hypothetical protein
MGTSCSRQVKVLSLQQLAWADAGIPQQHPQGLQSVHADEWLGDHVHENARPGVEHPQRNIDTSGIKIRGQTAADNGLGMTEPRVVDPDLSTKPRVPAIANYSRLGTMGVPLLACTTEPDCTRRWLTSARCGSSKTGWPVNPGKPMHELGYGIRIPGARSVLEIRDCHLARPGWNRPPAALPDADWRRCLLFFEWAEMQVGKLSGATCHVVPVSWRTSRSVSCYVHPLPEELP